MNTEIFHCPLMQDPNYELGIVPAYFLSNGYPDLIREQVMGLIVPPAITNEVRRLNSNGEMPGWAPLFVRACGAHLCRACIPGLSWGHGPELFIIPTGITPGREGEFVGSPPQEV
jgi:hypothetical protein